MKKVHFTKQLAQLCNDELIIEVNKERGSQVIKATSL